MKYRIILVKAKLAKIPVTITTDDGKIMTGIVEELDNVTIKLREAYAVTFIPVIQIEDVK